MFNWLKKISSSPRVTPSTAVGSATENGSPTPVSLPDECVTHKNQGDKYFDEGKLEDAEASYHQAIAINPNYAEAYNNLGNVLREQGFHQKAEHSLKQAILIKPKLANAYCNLGSLLLERGKLDEAIENFNKALELKPDVEIIYRDLSYALFQAGQHETAKHVIAKGIALNPGFADFHFYLGNMHWQENELDEAVACYQRALQIKPDYAEAYNNLGSTLQMMGRLDEAEACCRRALQIKPDYAEAHSNLGVTLENLCRLDEAMTSLRQALEIKPDHADAHSNLIFTLDLADTMGLSELHGERKKWDEAHAAPLWQEPIHSNDRTPARRLRVGYVSADFKAHSAAKVFGGMLTRYDRTQFEVFAYSNLKGKADVITDLFRQNVTVWRDISGLSDDAVAERTREDRIDILVDLSGHSAGNRLLVFARKPAPIQVTAWGYATGTGMRAMDVFFTDPVMVPPHEKQYFSEEVRYLPSVVGAFFMDQFPDMNELPALSNEIITFGSLNRLAKISDKTYRAWSEVLLAVPRSRLILKTVELNDVATQKRVVGYFIKAGVSAERIIMQGKTSWYEHVQAYNQIDIALDPFPHGGGVTTLEGMMMGVPAVTLRWPTTVGRLSASIMTTLGLTDWIAETQKQYVELAVQKASDLQPLVALRQQLRCIFTSSVIGDQEAYARAVEQEYRKLWQEWCTRQKAQQDIEQVT
jgi:predicted O-linked N-acetylglucosamine transferase (SPINDLY family)